MICYEVKNVFFAICIRIKAWLVTINRKHATMLLSKTNMLIQVRLYFSKFTFCG